MIKLRDYQNEIAQRAETIIYNHGFVYLAMEVRCGKTLTSLSLAERLGAEYVLFVTKKKAISSIESDYKMLNPGYDLVVINYESLHKIEMEKIDVIILDESHSMGAYPKPSKRAKMVRDIISKYSPHVCFLSGTPTPESYSQMYHQVFGVPNNPFREFKNFYRFADKYVRVKQKFINSMRINDYDDGSDMIIEKMKPYTISYTQQQAGFENVIDEKILYVDMKLETYELIKRLKRDLVVQGENEVILADTPVKLMQKTHQLCSGTIKFESGNSMVIDYSKAEFIKEYFKGKKIGIFYKFKEELNALREVFSEKTFTTELSVFNDTDCQAIALQIVSGREGISLRNAEALVYYNIDFSATSYWQSRDRMTTKERKHSDVYWIFSNGGIESSIYNTVINKKDFTLNHFRKL
jgi:hypothetical protein